MGRNGIVVRQVRRQLMDDNISRPKWCVCIYVCM